MQRLRRLATLLVAAVLAMAGLGAAAVQTARADDGVAGKTFTIATDTTFAPFEYRENGEMVGIDMDLVRAIAKDQGFNVTIQSLGFNAALQAVTSGQADMAIAGASITDERKASYDFSDPYFESGIQMAVAANDDSIKSYDDLKGKTVVAKTGAEGEAYAKKIADQYGFTVTSVDQSSTMYEMVKSKNAVAVFDDYPVLAYGISQNNGLKIVTPKVPNGEYGALVKKGANADLLNAFNAGLKNLKDSGEYEKILAKYLGEDGAKEQVEGKANADATAGEARKAVEGKKFTIATDTTFAPFEYRDGGEMVGIDMDLVRAIAKAEGFEVDIQSLGFNAALQAVTSGQADMAIAGASITDERKQSYDFSDPYFQSGIQMAVAANDDSIKSYDDLKGKTVVAKTGAEGESYAKKNADKYGYTVTSVDQSSTMYEMVKSGNAVAVFDDYPVLAYGISQNNGLKIVTPKVPNGEYGALVRKGANADLLAAFNEGLKTLVSNGEYEKILAKYLGEDAAKEQVDGIAGKTTESGSATTPVAKSSFWQLAQQSMPALLKGLKNTLLITLISFAVALVIGVVFGLMRVSPHKATSAVARVYVAIFRGTPILVWAFFFYFGVPQLTGHPLNIWIAGLLTLALNSGAYLVEIVRGAIQSVDPGQMEGARSLGLNYYQAMRKVILPQATKIAMPSVINQLVIMLKDSSLLLAIGFGELLYQAQQLYAANFRVTETLLMVGVIYFVAITLLTWLANIVDRKVNR